MTRLAKSTAILEGARAIERAAAATPQGTHQELADRLGVSLGRLSNWKRRGVPLSECPRIAERSGGALTMHDLRPDFFEPPSEKDTEAA